MQVRVLLFAQAADIAGTREIALDLARGGAPTVADAWNEIVARSPELESLAAGLAFAVNESVIHPASHHLRDGDTLAIIPPVSGG